MLTALLGCVALAAPACTSPDDEPGPAGTVAPAWEQVSLPLPEGPAGRVAVREAVECDGTWWLVGGVFGEVDSRPAGWRSDDDGRTWQPLRFDPRGYWAHLAVISSVACRGDRVVMVGAKS